MSQERQQDISKTIGRLVFDLFDLDYHEYKASLMLQNTSNKITHSRFEQLLNTMSAEEAIQVFSSMEQGTNLRDVEEKGVSDCIKMILQHFDIVMGHAFSSLNSLPNTGKRYLEITQRTHKLR